MKNNTLPDYIQAQLTRKLALLSENISSVAKRLIATTKLEDACSHAASTIIWIFSREMLSSRQKLSDGRVYIGICPKYFTHIDGCNNYNAYPGWARIMDVLTPTDIEQVSRSDVRRLGAIPYTGGHREVKHLVLSLQNQVDLDAAFQRIGFTPPTHRKEELKRREHPYHKFLVEKQLPLPWESCKARTQTLQCPLGHLHKNGDKRGSLAVYNLAGGHVSGAMCLGCRTRFWYKMVKGDSQRVRLYLAKGEDEKALGAKITKEWKDKRTQRECLVAPGTPGPKEANPLKNLQITKYVSPPSTEVFGELKVTLQGEIWTKESESIAWEQVFPVGSLADVHAKNTGVIADSPRSVILHAHSYAKGAFMQEITTVDYSPEPMYYYEAMANLSLMCLNGTCVPVGGHLSINRAEAVSYTALLKDTLKQGIGIVRTFPRRVEDSLFALIKKREKRSSTPASQQTAKDRWFLSEDSGCEKAVFPDKLYSISDLRVAEWGHKFGGHSKQPTKMEVFEQRNVVFDIDGMDKPLRAQLKRFVPALKDYIARNVELSGRHALIQTSEHGLQVVCELRETRRDPTSWFAQDCVKDWYQYTGDGIVGLLRMSGISNGELDMSSCAAGRYARLPSWRVTKSNTLFRSRAVYVKTKLLRPPRNRR